MSELCGPLSAASNDFDCSARSSALSDGSYHAADDVAESARRQHAVADAGELRACVGLGEPVEELERAGCVVG